MRAKDGVLLQPREHDTVRCNTYLLPFSVDGSATALVGGWSNSVTCFLSGIWFSPKKEAKIIKFYWKGLIPF